MSEPAQARRGRQRAPFTWLAPLLLTLGLGLLACWPGRDSKPRPRPQLSGPIVFDELLEQK